MPPEPRGILGYKRDGGVRCIFLGLKFSTPVFFWVEDLTVYFLGSEKSARIFLVQISTRLIVLTQQKGSKYTVLKIGFLGYKSHVFFGSKISSLVFLWVHNIRSMYFFGCKMCSSRKNPYSPHRKFFVLHPPTPQEISV